MSGRDGAISTASARTGWPFGSVSVAHDSPPSVLRSRPLPLEARNTVSGSEGWKATSSTVATWVIRCQVVPLSALR